MNLQLERPDDLEFADGRVKRHVSSEAARKIAAVYAKRRTAGSTKPLSLATARIIHAARLHEDR